MPVFHVGLTTAGSHPDPIIVVLSSKYVLTGENEADFLSYAAQQGYKRLPTNVTAATGGAPAICIALPNDTDIVDYIRANWTLSHSAVGLVFQDSECQGASQTWQVYRSVADHIETAMGENIEDNDIEIAADDSVAAALVRQRTASPTTSSPRRNADV